VNGHWRKSTNEKEGKSEQEFDAAFGNIFFELGSVFKEASRSFIFIFIFKRQAENFKNLCMYRKATEFIFEDLATNIHPSMTLLREFDTNIEFNEYPLLTFLQNTHFPLMFCLNLFVFPLAFYLYCSVLNLECIV
jgi:hypothetical protein